MMEKVFERLKGTDNMSEKNKIILIGLPIMLTLSTYLAFLFLAKVFGLKAGYFLGFLFYWGFWCLLIPYRMLGRNSFLRLFKGGIKMYGRNKWLNICLLVIPPLMAFLFGPFLERIQYAPLYVIVLSIPYGIVNGIMEEILWRGLYAASFPRNYFLGFLYPSLGFALSHISPLAVNPSSIGIIPFVMSALFIGLCWGWVAFKTKSIRWTVLSHALLDISGIGVLFYFS